jgi:hypothetical protein
MLKSKSMTTEQLGEKLEQEVKRMSPKEKRALRKEIRSAFMPKEISPLSMMSQMAQAAREVAREEKIFNGKLATERIQ